MNLLYICLIFGSLIFAQAEDVITLTDSNFQEALDSNPFLLVEFYAPWCGHCKKLAPEYETAATTAKALDPPVVLAKVDATVETNLASKYSVKGFPTLKWFVNGELFEYTGGRTADTIVSWVKKKTGPPATSVTTAADLKEFQSLAAAVAVGVFATEKEGEKYIKHASQDDDIPHAVCYGECKDVLDAAGVKSTKIFMLQEFDDKLAIFEGDETDIDEIKTFIKANSLPTIVPFTQQNAPKIFGGPIKDNLLIFLEDSKSAESLKIIEEVRPIAKTTKDKILFVTVEQGDSRILEFFGVAKEDMPTVRIVNMGQSGAKKYKFSEKELNTRNVEKFVEDYFAGNLQVDLKSAEPIPESEQGNVRVVVGKDFEEVVNQKGKDVLVEFYAPWCGHCKKLEPEYNALGEHFKDNDNIVIAKCDSTANEVERVQVTGFPTIKFFPADSDEIVDYTGERTKDGLIKWINENAKSLK